MTAIALIISSLAWLPTVNSQRVYLDAQAAIPYWLNISVPPNENVSIRAVQSDRTILEVSDFTGQLDNAYFVTKQSPVLFFQDGNYVGQITPEPLSITLLLTGMVFLRRRK